MFTKQVLCLAIKIIDLNFFRYDFHRVYWRLTKKKILISKHAKYSSSTHK